MIKRMFEAQKLKKSLQAKAVANAVYTVNRCLMNTLHSVTPEETWNGEGLCYTYLYVRKSCLSNDSKREQGQTQ
jgi:hypothetical protein